MKLSIFAYFNVLGGFHGSPFSIDHTKEDYIEILKTSLYSADEKTLNSLVEDDLFYLGSFDTITGDIVPGREFVVHMSEMVKPVIAAKFGGVVDERKGNNA